MISYVTNRQTKNNSEFHFVSSLSRTVDKSFVSLLALVVELDRGRLGTVKFGR
jgi:hypothetical protein